MKCTCAITRTSTAARPPNPVKRSQKQQQQAQHRLPSPLPTNPHIAIVGGGLAGLACALELASHQIQSTVFDTGEHGVGGRAATRSTLDKSLSSSNVPPERVLAFDHAAQYFVVNGDTEDPSVMQVGVQLAF